MTDRVYGELSDWHARPSGDKWEIFDEANKSIWLVTWRPSASQLDDVCRIYEFAFHEGRIYGENGARRDIRRALGLKEF